MTIEQPMPPAAEAPKKPSVLKKILGIVVGLIVAAGVAYGINYFGSDAAQTKAGDCAAVTGTTSKPDYKTVECTAPEANYLVGKVLEGGSGSCGENYDQYSETQRRGPDSKLCLIPRLTDGECHQFSGNAMGYPVVACSTSGAVKVTKANAESECAKDSEPLVYAEPKTVYCLSDPSAA